MLSFKLMANNVDPQSNRRRLLLAFDGSEASRLAFEHAATLARAMNSEILLTRVYIVPPHIWVHPEAEYREREITKLQAAWDAELSELAAKLEAEIGVPVRPLVRTLGRRFTVADEILATADEYDPILLCLATHGESALRRLVMGSVALDVLSRSKRPVVLINAKDR